MHPTPTAVRSRNDPTAQPIASAEALLLNYVERLARHRDNRVAVHIHMSRLQSHNRREHHLRIAVGLFEGLVRSFEGQIFWLRNADIVFIGHNVPAARLEEAVTKLRYLFADDPLMMFTDGVSPSDFSTWYRLDTDFSQLLESVRRLNALNADVGALNGRPDGKGGKVLRPMRATDLAEIEQILAQADLSNVIRNQPICAVTSGQVPKPVFEELYVSISDLSSLLAPDIDLTANRWLFQHLTETLDRRMLANVMRENMNNDNAFSLNLNVTTLLSPEFQRFDGMISTLQRGRIVVEIQAHDILADMGTFMFARDFVRDRGIKVCVDGINHLTLPMMDRQRVGADLFKIHWSAQLGDALKTRDTDTLREHIKAIGPARVILCRCETEEGLNAGRALGVALFQGRLIDRYLNERREIPPFTKA